MKVAIGCDPNASELKIELIDELVNMGHSVDDFGSDDPIYPNVVIDVGESVVAGNHERGVVLCGTGIGASIAANKVTGVFCALVTDVYQAERAALSNNANVIAMGAQVTGAKLARSLLRTWMAHSYSEGGRSEAKVNRISEYESKH